MATPLKMYRFTHPRRQSLMMIGILVIFCLIVATLTPKLLPVFESSPYLNGGILMVFLIGILACFWQVWQVARSVGWINAYAIGNPHKLRGTPRLLAPLVVLMKGNQLPSGMSTASAQSILDSVATRLDETREITRYLVNLLIFLGLLGTFYGLATTIPAVVDTIRTLNVGENSDASTGFGNLMEGLERQLGGMGTAFGSSLIGLTGSLLVGLLELFAGHGQNRFYREFEEWISHFTSVGMAENGMELAVDPNDDSPLARAFRGLNDSLVLLNQRFAQQADSNEKIVEAFKMMAENSESSQNMTNDMRNAVRSVESQLVRMNEDLAVGRDQTIAELRRELNAITSTLREAIDQPE